MAAAGVITTMMLHNIPAEYDLAALLKEIDDLGFIRQYDYVSLPQDWRSHRNRGFAFVNFSEHCHAQRFREIFQQRRFQLFGRTRSRVSVAHSQGLKENVLRTLPRARRSGRTSRKLGAVVVRGGVLMGLEEVATSSPAGITDRSLCATKPANRTVQALKQLQVDHHCLQLELDQAAGKLVEQRDSFTLEQQKIREAQKHAEAVSENLSQQVTAITEKLEQSEKVIAALQRSQAAAVAEACKWKALSRCAAKPDLEEEVKQAELPQEQRAELQAIGDALMGLVSTRQRSVEVPPLAPSAFDFQRELGRLRLALDDIQKVFKVLDEVLLCPLTMDTFQRPLLAPDGHSYERSCITTWLRQSSVSPITRQRMRRSQLLRNRPLERLVEALRGPHQQEPSRDDNLQEDEESFDDAYSGWTGTALTSLEEPSAALVGRELVTAIEEHNQESALALARRPLERAVLNGMYGEPQAPLHTFALLHGMPEVATVILNRSDFVVPLSFIGSGQQRSILAIHLAAARGDTTFCRAFLARCSGFYARMPVLRDAAVTLSSGEELRFQSDTNPIDIARSRGHHALQDIIEEAYNSFSIED